ncbi:class I SAM-dependent methyltransferase [Pseudohalioglobus sediminis]|uniref:Class I SAM-dependent methyltransferase n=1 Tax=Pseudohalioglobus sediminis TaxID=2606449 RepID=A0A5B0WSL5_9GAMM|nr:class I SAM-dependent methyltransferase [Pseudohalioglobus sediminis]KAA1190062.1 class I SAM-dependent methyltransferase [Pseudohalioglobus sediminis]
MSSAARKIDQYFEEVDCLLCGSDASVPATPVMPDTDIYGEAEQPYRDMRFQYVSCTQCGTVYLRRRICQQELDYFYNNEYHCYQSYDERGFIFKHLALAVTRGKIRTLAQLFPGDNRVLLDYGCGAGIWLELLRRGGVDWRLIGTEVNPRSIEAVHELGLEGYLCDEDTLQQHVAANSVGVIHLFHVIEHLPDPVGALRKLAEVLEPGGAIYGQTPNIDAWDCKLFGQYWSQWHVPRHLVLYTPDTLRRHAEAAGLEVHSISNSLSSATGWANSLEKWWALRRGNNFMPSSSRLYPYLTLAAIPLTLVQQVFSSTGNIDFVFTKPGGAAR